MCRYCIATLVHLIERHTRDQPLPNSGTMAKLVGEVEPGWVHGGRHRSAIHELIEYSAEFWRDYMAHDAVLSDPEFVREQGEGGNLPYLAEWDDDYLTAIVVREANRRAEKGLPRI